MKDVAHDTEFTAPATNGLKVLIADDHHLVRGGLKLCFKAIDQNAEVLEAETIESAIETFRAHREIDLVLIDLSMVGMDGATALDAFAQKCPQARIVAISANYDMKTVQAALGRGVRGLIPKLAGRTAFVNALRLVLDGGIYIPPEALAPPSASTVQAQTEFRPIAVAPVSSSGRAAALRGARLTARQIDVLAQLLDGKPNKQICRELNLAMGTVKCHVGAILGALEVNSRAEAIAAANKRGWREWLMPSAAHGDHLA
ncbi:MAG: response regulator transcription factor [Ramlibacter sp.]|nr:response regulator transcription factor [Ramlibacter sp.]